MRIRLIVASFLVSLSLPLQADFMQLLSPQNEEGCNPIKVCKFDTVEFEYVKSRLGKPNLFILDARIPMLYDEGHIPGALLLTDTKFSELYPKLNLPRDAELIVYCAGGGCSKSESLAELLQTAGYKNIKIYSDGMPDWSKKSVKQMSANYAAKLYGAKMAVLVGKEGESLEKQKRVVSCGQDAQKTADAYKAGGFVDVSFVAAKCEDIKAIALKNDETPKAKSAKRAFPQGEDEGNLDIEFAKKLLKESRKDVVFVDVRPKNEFDSGHLKGALNVSMKLPVKEFAAQMPKEKTVIFYCSSGTRALEIWLSLKDELKLPDMERFYYLDAHLKCSGATKCEIVKP